jgi:hypothetical protein
MFLLRLRLFRHKMVFIKKYFQKSYFFSKIFSSENILRCLPCTRKIIFFHLIILTSKMQFLFTILISNNLCLIVKIQQRRSTYLRIFLDFLFFQKKK